MSKDGYVYVHSRGHPQMNSKGYVLPSHLVWEEYTGHVVLLGESVHHRNGVKDDDRFENLRLYTSESAHQHIVHSYGHEAVINAHRLRAKGLTHEEIGKDLGVPRTTVSRWLRAPVAAELSGQVPPLEGDSWPP